MKVLFCLFCVIFISSCYAQTDEIDKNYKSGDTLIEVRVYEDLNSLRIFKKIDHQEISFYQNFDLDTKILREEGKFDKDGWWFGMYKAYSDDGELAKTIDYNTNVRNLFNGYTEPYEGLFSFVQASADSLLEQKLGKPFFKTYIIQNTNRSYCYGEESSYNWFEERAFEPDEFKMTYDLKWNEKDRFDLFSFSINRSGDSKDINQIKEISNYHGEKLISRESAEKIALKNGLSEKNKPFSYKFIFDTTTKNDLQLSIGSMPYETTEEGNTETKKYIFVILDAFTGKLIKVENKSFIGIFN